VTTPRANHRAQYNGNGSPQQKETPLLESEGEHSTAWRVLCCGLTSDRACVRGIAREWRNNLAHEGAVDVSGSRPQLVVSVTSREPMTQSQLIQSHIP
jgi:hypothetical protein